MQRVQQPAPSSRRRSRAEVGFSLIETLVALLILGWLLMVAVLLLVQEPVIARRMTAAEEALSAVEMTLEAFRAGLPPPLTSGQLDPSLVVLPTFSAAENPTVWVEVEPQAISGLTALTVEVRYTVQQHPFRRSAQTMVWRP